MEEGLETMNDGIKEGEEEGRMVEVREEEDEEDELRSSDLEIENASEWFGLERRQEKQWTEEPLAPNSRLPNAHGGLPTLQPLFNRSQKLTTHICASPLMSPSAAGDDHNTFGLPGNPKVMSYIPKTLYLLKNVEEDVIWITSGKDTGDIYYKNITWLHKALTKEDANAIEKPTDPGDNAKAGGSKSKSDTDVDEDSEGNESASETEVQAPVDKKAARKENQKEVKEEKRTARKNKVPKAVKKIREKLAKAQETR